MIRKPNSLLSLKTRKKTTATTQFRWMEHTSAGGLQPTWRGQVGRSSGRSSGRSRRPKGLPCRKKTPNTWSLGHYLYLVDSNRYHSPWALPARPLCPTLLAKQCCVNSSQMTWSARSGCCKGQTRSWDGDSAGILYIVIWFKQVILHCKNNTHQCIIYDIIDQLYKIDRVDIS